MPAEAVTKKLQPLTPWKGLLLIKLTYTKALPAPSHHNANVFVCSRWHLFLVAFVCNNALNKRQYGKVFPANFHGRKMRVSSFLRLCAVSIRQRFSSR